MTLRRMRVIFASVLLCSCVAGFPQHRDQSLLYPAHEDSGSSLYDVLSSIRFRNAGTTTSSDQYHWENIQPVGLNQRLMYLEAENVSCTQCVWADQAKYGADHPYLFQTIDKSSQLKPFPGYSGATPPSGMRSSVPLGGIGAGSFELRADGTLHEWTIHNAGPHGAAKIQEYPDAYFVVGVDTETRVVQTANGWGDRGVSGLSYSGAHPVSKLSIVDPSTDFNSKVSLDIFAFSSLKAGDMPTSSRPAVSFNLAVSNHESVAKNVSFMFQMPFAVEYDQLRSGQILDKKIFTDDEVSCQIACGATYGCVSWNWVAVGDDKQQCTMQSDTPFNIYSQGIVSGIMAKWDGDTSRQCLTMYRDGPGPMMGNISACASTEGLQGGWHAITSTNPRESLKLMESGVLYETPNTLVKGNDPFGSVEVWGEVPANSNATLSINLAWSFAQRDHFNFDSKQAKSFAPYGNKYADHYTSAVDAAWGNISPASRASALSEEIANIQAIHSALSADSVPEWLQDLLINSIAHTRNGMWWKQCPKCHLSQDSRVNASWGFWRQWEAPDCDDIDSIHNDGERHIPYIMLLPDNTRSKLAAWAGNQGSDGMLAEQILNTSPDTPQGRVMSDGSSMFIVYVLELLMWQGDTESLKLYYNTVKQAAKWQMSVSKQFGVPLGLETTYDILGFPKYQLSAYSSVYHLLAMRASEELARAMGDSEFADECHEAFITAQQALDTLQWDSENQYYHAGSSSCTPGQGCSSNEGVFSDAFYAQVLAYSLGLGPLVSDIGRLKAHLAATYKANCKHNNGTNLVDGCDNGLLTLTGRTPQQTDLEIWEMATYDHAVLAIHSGQMSVVDALSLAQGTGTSYSDRVNDQWNIAGIKFSDGMPSCTSHYGYHMTSWHLLFALSGQVANLTNVAQGGSLTFNPTVSDCGYSLPVVLPGVWGTLTCSATTEATQYRMQINTGSLKLMNLSVKCSAHSGPYPLNIKAGDTIAWTATNESES